jgi:hypothetical protein
MQTRAVSITLVLVDLGHSWERRTREVMKDVGDKRREVIVKGYMSFKKRTSGIAFSTHKFSIIDGSNK